MNDHVQETQTDEELIIELGSVTEETKGTPGPQFETINGQLVSRMAL